MKNNHIARTIAFAGVAVALFASSAFAASGHPSHEQLIKLRVIQILGFGILALLVVMYLVPAIGKILGTRAEGIAGSFGTAEKRKTDAASAETSAKKALAEFGTHDEEVLKKSKAEGERLKKNLLREAKEAAYRIEKKAKLEAEIEGARGLLEATNHLSDLAFAVTEDTLRAGVTAKVHDAMVDKFLDNLTALKA
ncbi:MAG: F0F1 ATP synthase subunit B family protein [Planctomycetota bacterium]|jgi:F-type H+-transporting ATPase subunit b